MTNLLPLLCIVASLLNLAPSADQAARLRDEVREAAKRHAEQVPTPTSAYRGDESAFLKPDMPDNGHAFNLASGGDFFRLLVDFPTTKHLHYIDFMAKWGPYPQFIVEELVKRMRFLKNANVTTTSLGFAGTVGSEKMHTDWHGSLGTKILTAARQDRKRYGPITWTLSWDSDCCGRQERTIYLHLADRNHDADMTSVFSFVKDNEYVDGLIQTALSGTPLLSTLEAIRRKSREETVIAIEFASEAKTTPDTLIDGFFEYYGSTNYAVTVGPESYKPQWAIPYSYPLVIKPKFICETDFK